jgi:magnesium transporter
MTGWTPLVAVALISSAATAVGTFALVETRSDEGVRTYLLANPEVLQEVMDLKRSVARLVRISSKQIDVIARLANGEFPLVGKDVLPFYRDIYDHLHRVTLLAENYRDLVGGLLNLHFNVIANRTNDVVKTLTIFSAVILPLSLIAGIYGMNFENMPELKTKYGYFFILGSMAIVAIALLVYFWRKGWIFQREDNEQIGKD